MRHIFCICHPEYVQKNVFSEHVYRKQQQNCIQSWSEHTNQTQSHQQPTHHPQLQQQQFDYGQSAGDYYDGLRERTMINTGCHSKYGQASNHTYDRNNNHSHYNQQQPDLNGYKWNENGNTTSTTNTNNAFQGFYGHSYQSHHSHGHHPFTSSNYHQAQDQNHLPHQSSQYQHQQINYQSYASGPVGVNPTTQSMNVNMDIYANQQHNYNNGNGYNDKTLSDKPSEKTIREENSDPPSNGDDTYLMKWSSPSPRPPELFWCNQQ